jgi:aminoglycoside/choline kinase family phosphotransferase
MAKPQLLLTSLAKYPSTLIHADYRLGNLALLPGTNQVVALDWQDASYAPAVLCVCWFLGGHEILSMRDSLAEYYSQRLREGLHGKFDQKLWQHMLAVGFMVEVLRKGIELL